MEELSPAGEGEGRLEISSLKLGLPACPPARPPARLWPLTQED